MSNSLTIQYLIDMAKMAREYAYVPYSHFKVGASVRTAEDKVFTGCNIEMASFGLTLCAERTALFKAVSEGFKNIQEIAVIADTETPVIPCGACLQALMEFNKEMKIVMANLSGDCKVVKINKLLTAPFTFKKDG